MTKIKEFDKTVDLRIATTWIYALVPYKPTPTEEVVLEEIKCPTSNPSLAERTGQKLQNEEYFLPSMGGIRLRMALDQVLWSNRDHVTVGELAEWFPRFLYLPRLKNRETLIKAIQDGANGMFIEETFATAEAYSSEQQRYLGLRWGGGAPSPLTNGIYLVKPNVAKNQQQKDAASVRPSAQPPMDAPTQTSSPAPPHSSTSSVETTTKAQQPLAALQPTNFVGSVTLSSSQITQDVNIIAEEVLHHLNDLPGARATINLEVEVHVPNGVESDVVRIVLENTNALGFQLARFEE